MANIYQLWFVGFGLMLVFLYANAVKSKTDHIQRISDPKEFKKFLRTHTNVLALFAKSDKELTVNEWNTFSEVALQMRGIASVVFVDCSSENKPCKKLKSSPTTFELKHYKDGEYHKLYDRKLTVKSLSNFLSNPTGDAPWEEDADAGDVAHVNTREELMRILHKQKPTLVMFYAPWCGHCKRLKPEFAAAATELKGTAILAGMDVDKPENYVIRTEYNITGFPTLCYFEGAKFVMRYGGENNKEGIVKWIHSPSAPVEAQKEPEWSEVASDVVHLTDDSFDEHINSVSSVLVMFYAPWCGHCKKMKPEYEQAAAQLKSEQLSGSLAAVDATKAQVVAKKYDIKGYPTVKYFKDGKYAWDFNERTADKIVEFMKDPKEPPPPPPEEAAWENTDSKVVHLDSETFRTFTKKKKHVLVMFYAPWCGHCKKAKPEFMGAADHFSDSKVSFAAVDCTKHASLCQTYDVSGYPTFRYFNYGKNDIKYTGGREKDDFIRFMSDPLSPLSASSSKLSPVEQWVEVDSAMNIHHLTDKTFDVVLSQQQSALVLFYAPWCGHCKAMKAAYAEAAAVLKANKYDCILAAVDATVEKSLQDRFHVDGFPTIKYFENGIETRTYNLGRTAEDFVTFMKNQLRSSPSSSQLTQLRSSDDFNDFINKHESSLVMFYATESHLSSFQAIVDQVKELNLDLHPATVNCHEPSSQVAELCDKTTPLRYFERGLVVSDFSGLVSVNEVLKFIKTRRPHKEEL